MKKKSKLLELVALDSITPADFKSMTEQCIADIKAAERELVDLRAQQESGEESKAGMERIRKVLRDAEQDGANGEITKEFVYTFIDKIFVTPEADGSMRLDIKIFTGESCEKYFEKIKNRSVQSYDCPGGSPVVCVTLAKKSFGFSFVRLVLKKADGNKRLSSCRRKDGRIFLFRLDR
ncbi:MAG: hypothetical protein PUE85_09520 [Firmicutes bacterium]|nr:hypothetical protein [Bacillota bacterium]